VRGARIARGLDDRAELIWRGGDVPGSVFRQTSSSSVGIEKLTDTFARDAASANTSTSRTIIGPRVTMWNGLRASPSASIHARVSL